MTWISGLGCLDLLCLHVVVSCGFGALVLLICCVAVWLLGFVTCVWGWLRL